MAFLPSILCGIVFRHKARLHTKKRAPLSSQSAKVCARLTFVRSMRGGRAGENPLAAARTQCREDAYSAIRQANPIPAGFAAAKPD